jgi:hypothetical protein
MRLPGALTKKNTDLDGGRVFRNPPQAVIGQGSIDLPGDFYCDVPAEALYDPYSEPRQLNLGQLSEDWEKLLSLVSGERLRSDTPWSGWLRYCAPTGSRRGDDWLSQTALRRKP